MPDVFVCFVYSLVCLCSALTFLFGVLLFLAPLMSVVSSGSDCLAVLVVGVGLCLGVCL